MNIALLSPLSSVHTIQLAESLLKEGHHVHVISARNHKLQGELNKEINIHYLSYRTPLAYIIGKNNLLNILYKINPDVLNTHYASGYGTLARISGFKPNILSLWGSDIYEFPKKSFIHKYLIKKNLQKADWVCSTSNDMANKAESILNVKSKMTVTPFGVDANEFYPRGKTRNTSKIVIGTVKSVSPTYGTDLLIKSFSMVYHDLLKQNNELSKRLYLKVVGGGSNKYLSKMIALARKEGVADRIEFKSHVEHKKISDLLNNFDLYVALSRSESFGVAILEASSCAIPVITSNVGGLPEVVINNVTGIIVNNQDTEAAAEAIKSLILDREKRKKFGKNGRIFILEKYDIKNTVKIFVNLYESILKDRNANHAL